MRMDFAASLKNTKLYFLSFMLLWFSGCLYMLFSGMPAGAFPLSGKWPFLVNVFMINFTFMGDAVFAVCLAVCLFFYYRWKKESLVVLGAFAFSETFIQVMKNIGAPQQFPHIYFEDGQTLFYHSPDAANIYAGSVSGHTATAFALATVLVQISKNARWQLPLLAGAILMGYSRMYLAGHLFADVLIAALPGTVSGLLSFYIVSGIVTVREKRKLYAKPLYPDQFPKHDIKQVPGQVAAV